jgi:PIN domain nuclease of toxin-antitoxin system
VKLLLDTHLLLWAAEDSPRLSQVARDFIADPANDRIFSAASLWEIAIKAGLGRADFHVDPAELRDGLLANGYRELPVSGEHALRTLSLPSIHKDPFDRILIAQAAVDGLTLLTADPLVAKYGGAIRAV